MTFLLNFTYLSEDFDTLAKNQWSKQSYLVTSRRRCKRSRYYYDVLFRWPLLPSIHRRTRLLSFLSILAQFPRPNLTRVALNKIWFQTLLTSYTSGMRCNDKTAQIGSRAYIIFKWGFGEKHLLKALQCQQCNKTTVNRVEPISIEKEAFFLGYFFLSLYRWDVCQKKTWPCSGHFRRRRSNKRTPQKHHIKCLIVIWPGSCTWQPIRNEVHLALWQSHKKTFQ